jgi:hypothetical protein
VQNSRLGERVEASSGTPAEAPISACAISLGPLGLGVESFVESRFSRLSSQDEFRPNRDSETILDLDFGTIQRIAVWSDPP